MLAGPQSMNAASLRSLMRWSDLWTCVARPKHEQSGEARSAPKPRENQRTAVGTAEVWCIAAHGAAWGARGRLGAEGMPPQR